MKATSLLVLLITAGAASAATIVTETFTMSTASVIPDGDLSGLVQTINPATSITTVDLITITLNTTGGWNGDLYAYLWHNGTLSVMVNRPGRTTSLPDGSATGGMTLMLADAAATDLHMATGALSGSYQPDGRDIAPSLALDTSPRTDSLADFIGSPASGDWRLFIADVANGGQANLTSWSITLTGAQVPEPTSAALMAISLAAMTRRRRR
jgi:hypothetical protein